MKTLKQIREKYDSIIKDQVQGAPDKLVLEGRESVIKAATKAVPSPSEMPTMLMFRRVAYRQYPGKQVVALYYSKLVNKYLSIPFGPDGNLNLSEAVVHDTIDEGAAMTALKTIGGGLSGAAQGAVKGAFKGAAIAADPGFAIGGVVGGVKGAIKGAKKAYDKAKASEVTESFKQKLAEKRGERVDENALSVALGALDIASRLSGSGNKEKDSKPDTRDPTFTPHKAELLRDKSSQKAKSSRTGVVDRTKSSFESKYSASLAKDMAPKASTPQQKVAENKITDIQNMISEGHDTMDMTINGRTITLNSSMAKKIIRVYESVNTKNKKIVEGMLNEDLDSFKKLLNFSIKA
jgi:hypothetical protein